ncbi:MAG: aldo/keto reductase [Gemmataceae bacterium]|nr:aldo/keto reductase [Gemmataceae bacterium]
MNLRLLGKTGMKVSELCMGTMTFGRQCDEQTSFAIMDQAANGGVNFIDTADVYPVPPGPDAWGKTEEIVGKWLKGKRQQFVLGSKCRQRVGLGANEEGLSPRHIILAVEASLKRLNTDYIDLYQAHAPDPNTPLEVTLRAMEDLQRQGKVRALGCSNYPAWQVALAIGIADKMGWSGWATVQPRYNLLFRDIEGELLPLCREKNLAVLCYNPLAGGMLTGKYKTAEAPVEGTRFALGITGELYRARYWHRANVTEVARLKELFQARGKSLTTAAVAWVLAQPGVTAAIIGASKPEQLAESLQSTAFAWGEGEKEACDLAWHNLPRMPKPPA